MKILFCGDVIGKAGRQAVCEHVPRLKKAEKIDFVVVNGENAAHGFGITAKICNEFYEAGVDALTTGNHVWDQREIIAYINSDPRLLRPHNFPKGTPGRGAAVFTLADGRKILVLHVMTRLFMDALDDPFACVEKVISGYTLGATIDAVIVDVHGEATSEKTAMGCFLDGRVSMVIGTHSHVPTADARLLPGGTAYQTDLGMCGDYDSVIGMKKAPAMARFLTKMPGERLTPAEGEATMCGVVVETDDKTGLAVKISPLRIGGCLQATPA
ncbi:MAG: TIGR00282 family metallophosphoesterase [Rhodospirillaceae bacterium]|jgi:2',3'-cyclic-nucleotide 2'-phosphodiesterase|nr:TIGR00282 family metallophosphoesterase [Rhodospirillaceae bacterium]MBT5374533.1 TIGR00282 family metallophosphoesterase [Rhodospirillaceae bacterium]MBT5659566.1 TIGR00282 family metallophosphoesterase [Rhodospirillaceae bacterium]MBT7944226.1 TIGR00282 family metallophosphoesterase [Alphaproteobacteria bacterium]